MPVRASRARARGLSLAICIGLLATACSSTGFQSPAETLQQERGKSDFGYVIGAVPPGYRLCGIGTPTGISLQPDVSASLVVYGDGQMDDPYDGPLYAVALFDAGPLDQLDLGETTEVTATGVPARLGTIDGLLLASLPAASGSVLTYEAAAGRTVQLAVRGADGVDLLALADSVEIGDDQAAIGDDALPEGFVNLGDIYRLEAETEFLFTLDYQLRSGPDDLVEDQITLLGSRGSARAMEAFRFRAGFSEPRDVNGSPGVVAEVGRDGNGPQVVSWQVNDEVILRLFSFSVPIEELFEVAESVQRVEGDDWAELRADFDPGTCPL